VNVRTHSTTNKNDRKEERTGGSGHYVDGRKGCEDKRSGEREGKEDEDKRNGSNKKRETTGWEKREG
jgi:hypothetical protein